MIQKKVRINIVILICIMIMAPAAISISKGSKRLNADIALSKALIAERKRNYPFMKKLLLKIDREIYPIDVNVTPIAWYLGFSEFYLQERSAAFEHFKEAERVNPNHLMVLNDLATSYNLSGDVNMAIKYYKKALSIQPEFGDAIVNLSIVYYNQGMLDEAYNTIIKHITIVEPHQVVVFKTILTAKALNITGTDQLPPDFEGHFKSVDSVKDLLLMIRGFNGKLEVLL